MISKSAFATIALVAVTAVGCQTTSQNETAATAPSQAWATTGVQNGVGTDANVAASAEGETLSQAWVTTGVSSLPGSGAATAATEEVVVDETVVVVEPVGTATRCGLVVVAVSPDAVGDPCMTSVDFVRSLNLPAAQEARALAAVENPAGVVAH